MHIIDLAIICFNEMRYCNFLSSLLGQNSNTGTYAKSMKRNRAAKCWTPFLNDWVKINVDASKRHTIGSTTIGYVMKDRRGTTI